MPKTLVAMILTLLISNLIFQCSDSEPQITIIHDTNQAITTESSSHTSSTPESTPPPNSIPDVETDSTPPICTITTPENHAYVLPDFIIEGTCWDDTGVTKVELAAGQGDYMTVMGTTQWKYIISDSTEGPLSLMLKAYDSTGNETWLSATYQVVTEADPPSIEFDNVSQGSWIQPNKEILGTASALAGIQSVAYQVDGNGFMPVEGTETWSCNVSNLTDGYHYLEIRAIDRFDQQTIKGINLQIESTPPELFINKPAGGYDEFRDEYVLSGTAFDAESGISGINIKIGDKEWTFAIGTEDWEYTWDATADTAGIYDITIQAVDNVGLTTEKSVNLAFYETHYYGTSANVSSGNATMPDITAINNTPVVCFPEHNGTAQILYTRLWDGTEWNSLGGTSLNIDANKDANAPAILADDENHIFVAWYENDGSKNQIYVKEWNGSSWTLLGGGSVNVDTGQNAENPHLAYLDGEVYVVFSEYYSNRWTLYMRIWDGSSWSTASGRLEKSGSSGYHAYRPFITMRNGRPWVSWDEYYNSDYEIFTAAYIGSWSFYGNTLNRDASEYGHETTMGFYGLNICVAWREYWEDQTDKWVINVKMRDVNGSWSFLGSPINRSNQQNAYYPQMAYDESGLYVSWYETLDSEYQVNLKHYDEDWYFIGDKISTMDSATVPYPNIELIDGHLYLTYVYNNGANDQIVVQKFVLPQ